MKRIINGLLYDTEKAEKITTFESQYYDVVRYSRYQETIYRTKKGRFFALKTYTIRAEGYTREVIEPLTDREAYSKLAEYDPDKALVLFPEKHVEEA